jgi:hypothetical protein
MRTPGEPVKRPVWTATFQETYTPPWPCPRCRRAHLKLVPGTLRSEETALSRSLRTDGDWDPEWISLTVTAWLKCTDSKCAEDVALLGKGGPEPEFDEEHGMSWSSTFRPLYMFPMPDIAEIPDRCPGAISLELRASFQSFWSDRAAAANRLRSALERLLDHLGVKTRTRKAMGGFHTLTLHDRIELFEKGEPGLGSHLLALKWLGNTGSHGDEVSVGDLLDAYEVTEHCLAEILTQRSKRIAAIAKNLNKKHAPRGKK